MNAEATITTTIWRNDDVPETKRRTVDVDVLLGDGKAKISRGLTERLGIRFNRYVVGSYINVELTCNQDADTIRRALATACGLAEEEANRYHPKLVKIVEAVATEVGDD